MQKILAKIITFVIILNTLIGNLVTNVFAADALKFKWNQDLTLTDSLDIAQRKDDSDEVFLSWDITRNSGVSVDRGNYTLRYPIADGKNIEFVIEKNADVAKVTYKVNNRNGVSTSKPLDVYKPEDKVFKAANQTNFPVVDPNFKINFDATGVAKNVSFTISKNKGFTFRYEGNTIKFIWFEDLFYLVTNGISQGNIYDFNLSLRQNTANTVEDLKVFTGININTLKAIPIANGGKDLIDQTTVRPITEYPGENSQIKLEFDMPKEYNTTNSRYEYIQLSDTDIIKKATETVLDFGNTIGSKAFQIKINNIYGTLPVGDVDLGNGVSANITRDALNQKIIIIIKGIGEGTIYNPVKLSAERTTTDENFKFLTIPSVVPIGKVYTYPKFSVVSLGTNEFYIKVEPFEGYNGFYTLYQGSSQGTLEKWAEHEEKNKGSESIMIPIGLSAINPVERYFKVDFKFTPFENKPTEIKMFSSQTLKYKPFDSDILLSTPKNLKVKEANIIRDTLPDGSNKDELFVTFKWDIGHENIIKGLIKNNRGNDVTIKYPFYEGKKPENSTNEFLAVDLVFSQNAAGEIEVVYNGTSGENGKDYTDRYIVDSGKTTIRNEFTGGIENKVLEANVSFRIPVSDIKETSKEQFQYPGIYFITNKGMYSINNGVATQNFETGKSLYTTLTLNGLVKIEVPSPQNITIEEKSVGKNKFNLKFDSLFHKEEKDLLYNYLKIMLEKRNLELNDDSIKYNVYITEDKKLFDELIKYDNERERLPENIKDKIKTYDYKGASIGSSPIDVKNINLDDGTSLIENIRERNIIKIKDMNQNKANSSQNIEFLELDENQSYYLIAETVLYPVDVAGNVVNNKIDNSKYSTIVTVTTLQDSEEPSDNEKIPAAPTNFVSKETTLNSTKLIWDRVIETPEKGDNSKLEYQFIKVKGQKLDDKFLKSKDSYKKTWDNLKDVKSKQGFKTFDEKLYEFKESDFLSEHASKDKYEYLSYTGTEGVILDKDLAPNQVYFYYIRTVRTIDDKDISHSVWVPLSVTSKNTEGPKNLRVERGDNFDKKTEVIISFDIPKMNIDLIGTEYDILYGLRKDTNPWEEDKKMEKEKMVFKENPDGKTIKVKYTIKGLKSGSSYSIKVKIFNKAMNISSIYSNEVEHRTDFDNAENNSDQQLEDFENNFNGLVDKLKKEAFWFIKNTPSETNVIYRPAYFDEVLNSSKTSILELEKGKEAPLKIYYLPASAVFKAFDQNKGFNIKFKNSDVIFSAKSINPAQNQAIKKLEERRNADKTEDYFIKLSVEFREAKYNVNGSINASPLVDIKLDAVATTEKIVDWDLSIADYVDELLKTDEFSIKVKEKIKELILDKKDNATILKEVENFVNKFKESFAEKIEKKLKSIIGKTYYTEFLNGNLIFTTNDINSDMTAYGYKAVLGNWKSVNTSEYAGKKAIFTNELGSYIFTAKKIIINGLSNLPNANVSNQLISKYGLDDFFGKNGNIDLKSNTTRNAVIGTVARMAGAKRTESPLQFLKSKGINISSRNTNGNITSQEAVYLVMKVYELRTSKSLETIKIRNYNKTANIKGLNKAYKKAVQAAFDIDIYSNENMNPNGSININEFLQLISNLASKIGI